VAAALPPEPHDASTAPAGPARRRWPRGRPALLAAAVLLPACLALALLALPRQATRGGAIRLSPVPTVQIYPPGTRAPDLRLATLDGGTVHLAALRGRPVVVNFWAPSCKPCAREFPLLAKATAAHRADRLALVGVLAPSDRPASARSFVRRAGASWPTGIDPGPGPSGPTMTAYGVVGLPETFFVRRDGTLASRQLGELTEAVLERQLAAILPG